MTRKRTMLKGLDIILIDDEDDSIELIQIILETYGATIYIAPDGAAGLTMIEDVQPDIIITDLSMPQMDGWELNQTVRQNDQLKDTPIIALTAHAMRGDREMVLEAGFDGYISKPISAEPFVDSLIEILVELPAMPQR